MADETPEQTVDRLNQTIAELNARTAAYDMQVLNLQQSLAQAEQRLAEIGDQVAAEIAGIQAEATESNRRTLELYNAQNVYVLALESKSPDQVKAAIEAHQDAQDALQLSLLQAKLKGKA